ncbi:hypothetical protein AAC387_Pa01g1053 [Persea americana]
MDLSLPLYQILSALHLNHLSLSSLLCSRSHGEPSHRRTQHAFRTISGSQRSSSESSLASLSSLLFTLAQLSALHMNHLSLRSALSALYGEPSHSRMTHAARLSHHRTEARTQHSDAALLPLFPSPLSLPPSLGSPSLLLSPSFSLALALSRSSSRTLCRLSPSPSLHLPSSLSLSISNPFLPLLLPLSISQSMVRDTAQCSRLRDTVQQLKV